jgi:hypothetical protein
LKCSRKHQGWITPRHRPHDHVFQDRIFLHNGHEEEKLLQFRNRHPEADAANAVTLLESEGYPLFIFCADIVVFTIVINNEWKGRRMCQYVCNGFARRTDEAKIKVGWRPKYEASPFLANVCEFIPPFFTVPSRPSGDMDAIIIPVKDGRSIMIKDVKKRIIIEDVDRRSM